MELAKQQRTIVDKKSMNTKKIGDYLRSQRETQGMELMQISEYTKININVLKRLEATDFDSLPSKAYVRGFVQNYCRAIRGNTKEALGVLDYSYREYFGKDVEVEEDVLQDTQTQDVVHHLPETELKKTFGKVPSTIGPSPLTLFFEQFSKIISNKNFYLPLAAILIVVGISLSLYKFVSRKVTENVAPIEVAKNTESTGDIKPKDASLFLLEKAKNMQVVDEKKEEVTTAEQVEQAATNEVASSEKLIEQMRAQDIMVQTPLDLRNGRVVREKTDEDLGNYPYVDFNKIRNSDIFELVTDDPDIENTEILPQIAKEAVDPNKQNIFINAVSGDSWLTYKIENKEVKSLILRQGKKLFLQGEQILLFLGNVNVTKIFYNNQKLISNTKSGVKSLIFPETNSTNFELPLFVANKKGVLFTSHDYKILMDDKPEE